jgi:hypothetical protein
MTAHCETQPKDRFFALSALHRVDFEGPQRVELTRSEFSPGTANLGGFLPLLDLRL